MVYLYIYDGTKMHFHLVQVDAFVSQVMNFFFLTNFTCVTISQLLQLDLSYYLLNTSS